MTFLEFLLAAALGYSLWLNVQGAQRRLEKLEDDVADLTFRWENGDEEEDGPDGGEKMPRGNISQLRKTGT